MTNVPFKEFVGNISQDMQKGTPYWKLPPVSFDRNEAKTRQE